MYKLRTVIDGLPERRTPDGHGALAKGSRAPIPIDDLLPVDGDPATYLEGRVAFYIALLEELIRRGADTGDAYFMKDCLDALLKMTKIGRAKVDLNVGGGLSKLRDEIDFSGMTKEELEDFVAKAKGEVNVRHSGSELMYSSLDDPDRVGVDSATGPKRSSRRHKSPRNNDRPRGEANATSDGGADSPPGGGPGSVATDLP